MNEPIEHAQTIVGKTTAKALLACVKLGTEGLSMHGHAAPERASYSDSFVFTVSARKGDRRKGTETTSEVSVPGYVSNGHDSTRAEHTYDGQKVVKYTGVHRPLTGFWFLSYCPRERMIDVLELLPNDAEVSFHVWLDAGTHELLTRAEATMNFGTERGLHADHLYMIATYKSRGKTVSRRYLIDTTAGAHNSARFGK
jgi:hypothetical protein